MTMPATVARPDARADAIAACRARVCRACWAPVGLQCTVSGKPGDHLARWLAAESAGAVDRAYMNAIISGLTVIADHVIVPEGDL